MGTIPEIEVENSVQDCGLFLSSCGFLGSRPDGIIDSEGKASEKNKGVLEVKCPWTHRSSKIKDAIETELGGKDKNSFYLTTAGDLNKNHSYWHQVQGEIVATSASWAHFVA